MTLDELIVELEKLQAERTQGEWIERLTAWGDLCGPDRYGVVASMGALSTPVIDSASESDRKFIAKTANALPTLLKVIKMQHEALEKIRGVSRSINTHYHDIADQVLSQTDAIVKEMGQSK